MRATLGLTAAASMAAVVSLGAQPAPLIRASLTPSLTSSGTGMRFEQYDVEVLDVLPQQLTYRTSDGRYRFALDTSQLSWKPECICFRDYVVIAQDTVSAQITRHKFMGSPSGTFEDEWVRVRLSLIEANDVAHSAEVGVPVGSAPGNEPPIVDVQVDPKSEGRLASASLGGATVLYLTVRNTSRHLSVTLAEAPAVSARSGVWKSPPSIRGAAFPVILAPGRAQRFELQLEPDVWQSMALSFRSANPQVAHTTVDVDVPYVNATLPGRRTNLSLEIPLRFEPNLPMLGAWLIGGVVLGTLLPLVTGDRNRLRMWPRSMAAALLTAVILEAIGMFLVQNKSKLVLFDFAIDPWQPTPVLVMGLVSGILGLKAAQMLQQAVESYKAKKGADLAPQP